MSDTIVKTMPLEPIWQTPDPFLFCVHHLDFYPKANAQLGPDASLQGHQLGQDFMPSNGDDWRMYHGQTIPGFPAHPHRGFETITVTTQGLIDHADSMGAAGRYGNGDTQWMTAGKGVQHAEMFPLLDEAEPNPLELFQIWLNLPAANKMVEPHFTMFWNEQTPQLVSQDESQRETRVKIVVGDLEGLNALAPPPDSWASGADNEVAVWIITMDANAQWTLPAASAGLNRRLYYYDGAGLSVDEKSIPLNHCIDLISDRSVALKAGEQGAQLLLLQGRPINEPVAQYGPFVMNNKAELQQAFADYQATQFGGWPWPEAEQSHGKTQGRFARYADGREEQP